jgi:hypothetical protein
MRGPGRLTLAAPPPDPFGEKGSVAYCSRLQVLGGQFDFETNSARLLRIVRQAYERLPAHKLPGAVPHFRVRLVLTGGAPRVMRRRAATEPPAVRPLAGTGLLCGAMGQASFVTCAPAQRAALIVVSRDVLRYPYHIRYELLEFAVYVLAARTQQLTPLHAACVGHAGAGVLLVGSSGSGKSTLVLHCLLAGLDLLAEDSVLVKPADLRATGVPSFLHLRRDSLRFLDDSPCRALLREACPIRRRSGVEKLEIDLRRLPFRLAPAPLTIGAVVFLSAARAQSAPLLTPLPRSVAVKRLAAAQRYAASQPGWDTFRRYLGAVPAYELRRAEHPSAGARAVRELLAQARV